MNNIKPVPIFSIHPPVHHANLKVRSSEPPLNKDLHQIFQDSLESDSEISIQEIKFPSNLQKQNQDQESLIKEVFEEMEPDSLEEESPQFKNLSKSEEASNEIVKLSGKKLPHPQVPVENKSQQLLVDKYSDLRYDPNWKNNKEEGEISALKRLQPTEESSTQGFSWDPLSSSKETSFELSREKSDLEKSPQSSITLMGSEFLSSNYERGDLNSESISFLSSSDTGDKSASLSEHIKSSSSHNDVFLPGPRPRPRKCKQDIVEKNKVTLGLSIHNTGSYLHQHNKKMGVIRPEKISSAVMTDTKPKSTEEAENPVVNPEDKWHQRARLLQVSCSFELHASIPRMATSTGSLICFSKGKKFCPSSESQPVRVSPDTQLTHIMEQHQQALMQLTEVQPSEVTSSNTMFPSIFSRIDSESQLDTGKSQTSQTTLSRCNSEGYLLQLEKQKKHKDRVASKNYRMKGYQKKDVKLGGLGPDFESIKDKIKTLKQQKEYAKQVKEYNMKARYSKSKPQTAKPESKSSVSRQKALEYARKIPKPKPVLASNLNDQESEQKGNLSCSGKERNLPEISLLEVLQNRHEREKQAVAAFKVLHIV
ncbi:jhy protein homolog [Petaurus breviceps papuanus]|uniref:jhy protein homolog n=1 Tax=Petaurus breviceps papuanus TaxID=3040969 RepID=UPI0036DA6259